jgi:hypothetical protein
MKEIKGLEGRLYGLEQLMVETRKIVQEQSDLTQVCPFQSNVLVHLAPHFLLPCPVTRLFAVMYSSAVIILGGWISGVVHLF